MKRIKNIILTVIVLLTSLQSVAQNYPVQAQVQLLPPFTSYLPDYADPFNNQMKVMLTLTDFTVASYQVKIRVTMEGNGYSIVTNEYLNLPPITISPGVPVEISGSDLAPYLATENLIFTGIDVADYSQRKVLPEGPCTICVEVIDFTSPNGTVLGNPACSQAWFARKNPPMLNQPMCGNNIPETTPQQILFNWSPDNTLNTAGLTTDYTFELFENNTNPDDNIDPNQIVNSTLPIYFQVTSQTFINYGIVEPQLQIGKEYIWRVKAGNNQNRDLYLNNGYSQVCSFVYGSLAASLADGIVLELETNGTGPRQGFASWNANGVFDSYVLEVRKTGNTDYEWFPNSTVPGVSTANMKINSLEPETQYEARIKGLILPDYESEYSALSTFITNPPPNYECGTTTMPATAPNITPLPIAIPGMVFSVGQFDMLVTSIESTGTPGRYKGRGKMSMAFLVLTINVEFDDILVDDNLAVREGKVIAITDGMDVWEENQLLDDAETHILGFVATEDMIEFAADSSYITINFDGTEHTFDFPSNGAPIILNSDDGVQFTVWPDGRIDTGTWDNTSEETLDALANYQVKFEAAIDQNFGFDTYNPEHPAWVVNYEEILLSDNTKYYTPYKSVADNTGDVVIAKVVSDTALTGLVFKIDDDIIESSKITAVTGGYKINLDGYVGEDTRYIGVYNYDDKIGRMWVIPYAPKEVKLTIVPVNNANASLGQTALQTELNKIYGVANTSFDVTVASNFDDMSWDTNNNGLDVAEDDHAMTNYSDEMKLIRQNYFEANPNYDKTSLFIFVVPSFSNNEVDGYMVRSKALGFVSDNASAKTIAHEIGHGAFAMEHTFPTVTEGTTDNLLDYKAEGTDLTFLQWEQIFKTLPVFSFLDDAEDGEAITITEEIPLNYRNTDSTITLLSPAGQLITIPKEAYKISFFTTDPFFYSISGNYSGQDGPIGSLRSFSINEDGFEVNYSFIGTGNDIHYKSSGNINYIDSLTYFTDPSNVLIGFPFYNGNSTFGAEIFKVSIDETSIDIQLKPHSHYVSNFGDDMGYENVYSAIELIYGQSQNNDIGNGDEIVATVELATVDLIFPLNSDKYDNFYSSNIGHPISADFSPLPSIKGYDYLNSLSAYAKKGEPLASIIIGNALWISKLDEMGFGSLVSCISEATPAVFNLFEFQTSFQVYTKNIDAPSPSPFTNSNETILNEEFYQKYNRLKAELSVLKNSVLTQESLNSYITTYKEETIVINGGSVVVQQVNPNFGIKLSSYASNLPCSFTELDLNNRLKALGIIIKTESLWNVNNVNLLEVLLKTTPIEHKKIILSSFRDDGWFQIISDQINEIDDPFDNYDYDKLLGVFEILNGFYEIHGAAMTFENVAFHTKTYSVSPTYIDNSKVGEIYSTAPILRPNIPQSYELKTNYSEFPIFIGDTPTDKKIGSIDNYDIWADVYHSGRSYEFKNNNLSVDADFKVTQKYGTPVFHSGENPYPDIELDRINTEYNLDPFEVVEVIFTSSYGAAGFDKGQTMLVPVYQLILIDKAIEIEQATFVTRMAINGIEIIGGAIAVATSPFTAGGSLAIMAGITASLDVVIESNRQTLNSQQYHSEFHENWDNFKLTTDIIGGVHGFAALSTALIKKTRAFTATYKMNKLIKNLDVDNIVNTAVQNKKIQYVECFYQGKKYSDLESTFSTVILANAGGSLLSKLDNPLFSVLKGKVNQLDDVLKPQFYDDFANATDNVLTKLQNDDLFSVWKNDFRSNNIDELISFKGKGSLRNDYITAVNSIADKVIELRALGKTDLEIAQEVSNLRRQTTIDFKGATPDDMLDLIFEFNDIRYTQSGLGDKWGLTWNGALQKYTKNGVTNYERIIEVSSTPLGDKQKLGKALYDLLGNKTLPILEKYRMTDLID